MAGQVAGAVVVEGAGLDAEMRHRSVPLRRPVQLAPPPELVGDVAPPLKGLLMDQSRTRRGRYLWAQAPAYGRFADATGRVRTTNEAVWVAGTKERLGS